MRFSGQRGVALISALLVVALATTAAVALSAQMQLSLRRGGNLFTRDQAWQYLLGGEAFTMILLETDLRDNKVDHLDELWAQPLPPLPVEGGVVTGKLSDLQGRININGLLDNDGKLDAVALERLKKLFSALDIEPARLDAIVDWIDGDNKQNGHHGAEDDYYLGLEYPYRTANRLLDSPAELVLIRDIKGEELDALRDEIIALPVRTRININTASDTVLQALGLDAAGIEAVNEGRPFENIKDFNALGLIADQENETGEAPGGEQNEKGGGESGLSVQTEYFLLETTAKIGRAKLQLYSIIHRGENGDTKVVSRSLGTL